MTNPLAPRYSRQVLLKEWGAKAQEKLAQTHFVVIGAGGIGSPALLALTESGAGHITVIDADRVEETNLPRQSLHTPARLGMNKAVSAKAALAEIDPAVPVEAVAAWADDALLATILAPEVILIDASDNSKTRHLANRAALKARCRLISASAVRFSFQVLAFDFRTSTHPCYDCFFPEDDEADVKAAEIGVFGAVTGMAGNAAAAEAMKLAVGIPGLVNKILIADTLTMKFNVMKLAADPACRICGDR